MGAGRIVEQVAGVALFALILVDVFFTVLYARIGGSGMRRLGAGFLSKYVGRGMRCVLLAVARRSRHRLGILSYCGPLTLLGLIALWIGALVAGAALAIHPLLGTAIVAHDAPTPTDFAAALYAAATGLAVNGANDFVPTNAAMRLAFVGGSIIGVFITTLTVTYLLQVYTALQRRNALALDFDLYSCLEADAARVLISLAPRGDFSLSATNLAELAEGMGAMGEAFHFYPVVFYFPSGNVRNATARMLQMALDTVTLMRSALAGEAGARVAWCASSIKLWHASTLVSETLGGAFLGEPERGPYRVTPEIRGRWQARFHLACERLREAGLEVTQDEPAAFERYAALRAQWQQRVEDLGLYMGLTREEIDPPGYRA